MNNHLKPLDKDFITIVTANLNTEDEQSICGRFQIIKENYQNMTLNRLILLISNAVRYIFNLDIRMVVTIKREINTGNDKTQYQYETALVSKRSFNEILKLDRSDSFSSISIDSRSASPENKKTVRFSDELEIQEFDKKLPTRSISAEIEELILAGKRLSKIFDNQKQDITVSKLPKQKPSSLHLTESARIASIEMEEKGMAGKRLSKIFASPWTDDDSISFEY